MYSYIGVGIGYLNAILLMPHFFSIEQVGLTQILLSISAVFSLTGTLGFNGVINRVFSQFRSAKNKHNGFPFLLLAVGLLGFLIILIAFFVLKPTITENNIEKSPLLVEYLFLLVPLILFRLFFSLLDGYNKNLFDAVTGTFWVDLGFKAMNFVFIVLFAIHVLSFRQYMFGFSFAVCFPVFPVLYKLIARGDFDVIPRFKLIDKKMIKQITTISAYTLLGSSSGIIVVSIDRIMVNEYLSLGSVGIFSICALFATIIKIPFSSLNKISTPFLAEAWKVNDLKEILTIYQKATINQLVFATLLFVGIIGNLDNIFRILPAEYEEGRAVVVIYSFAFLIMTMNASGGQIIGTSKYFRILTFTSFLTAILTVSLNIIFIPILGINGAAIATLITYIVTIVFRILYLKYKMNLYPYNFKHLITIAIGTISFLPTILIGSLDSLYLDVGVKSIMISIIYITLIYRFEISDEFNKLLRKYIKMVLNILT